MIEFKFVKNLIKMNISISDDLSIINGVENGPHGTKILKISTPQFKAQPVSEIPVQLITNFKGLETIKSDKNFLTYSDVKISEEKMSSGYLYQWNTPTKGSSFYFYFQDPMNKTLALKFGPIAASINIKFDWSSVIWVNLTSDH